VLPTYTELSAVRWRQASMTRSRFLSFRSNARSALGNARARGCHVCMNTRQRTVP